MTIASADVLSRHLKPLCPRDNHVMKYESDHSRANTGDQSSYHCGYVGCSVRYNSDRGYYMLMGMPGHTYAVDEPGVNTLPSQPFSLRPAVIDDLVYRTIRVVDF